MNTLKLIGFTALLGIVFMTLVGYTVAGADTTNLKLEGVTWVLKSYGDEGNLTQVLPDKAVTLIFYKEDKSVGGNSGVNSYGGDYAIEGSTITISNLIMTLMAGPELLMRQEAKFIVILQSAQSYHIEGQRLTIIGAEGRLVFTQK